MLEFSKEFRLLKKHEFDSVFANKPKRLVQKYLLALSIPNQKNVARLGMMISKRWIKQAVKRNRLKRVIRESFRQHRSSVIGLDIIVLVRADCSALCAIENKSLLRSDVDKLWHS